MRFVISTKLFNHIDPTVRNAPNNLCRKSEVNGKESYLTASFIAESAVVTCATRVCSPCEYDLVEGMFIGVHSDVSKHDWLFEGENKGIGNNFSALENLDNHLAAGKDHGDVNKDVPSTPGSSLVEDARPCSMDIIQDVVVILAPGDVRPETGSHLSLTPSKTIRAQRSWGRCQVLGVRKLARLRRLLVWWKIQRKAFRHPPTTIRTKPTAELCSKLV